MPDAITFLAVAEKLSALRTADYFRERAARAAPGEAESLLDSFGTAAPPREGDELTGPVGDRHPGGPSDPGVGARAELRLSPG